MVLKDKKNHKKNNNKSENLSRQKSSIGSKKTQKKVKLQEKSKVEPKVNSKSNSKLNSKTVSNKTIDSNVVSNRINHSSNSDDSNYSNSLSSPFSDIISEIKEAKAHNLNLISALHIVQDRLGYIPKDISKQISRIYNEPLARVYSVITFYNEFNLNKRGKHLIRVCLGTACKVNHNRDNLNFLKEKFQIEIGKTTSDNLFTLETVNCFGACSLAPVVEIDGKLHGHMDTAQLEKILNKIKKTESKGT